MYNNKPPISPDHDTIPTVPTVDSLSREASQMDEYARTADAEAVRKLYKQEARRLGAAARTLGEIAER